MKRLTIILFFMFFISTNAQLYNLGQDQGLLRGGFGVTWINNQPFYAVHLTPEIAFSNIGIGLNLNFEFDSSGKLRKEDFNEFSDYLSIIRYIRYGYKNDPLYFRLGALDYATLGNGSIMYMYNNSPSFDARKVGLELDMDFNEFGFEFVYGNFLQAGVVGLRGFVRPLKFSSLGGIPILGNFEVGATFATDVNKYAGVSSGTFNPVTDRFSPIANNGSIKAVGLDLGLPIIRSRTVKWVIYYDYVKLLNFGSGTSAGFSFALNGLGLINIKTKFERRFNQAHYLPAYFNSMYELQRFKLNKTTGKVTSKIQELMAADKSVGNGWYGQLLVRLLNSFDIIGSYQRLDNNPKSGLLHIATEISPKGQPFIARAGYDKINIQSEKDIFKLDDRSFLFAEFGYKPLPYLVVSMIYRWTFTPVRDTNNNIVNYIPQKKIEPRVSLVYPLNF